MFIKGQNVLQILNLDSVSTLECNESIIANKGCYINYKLKGSKDTCTYTLGLYKTTTRCKEVFNELCSNLKDGATLYELPKE